MPQSEPITSLLRLAELEGLRTKKPNAAVESELEALLSQPLAPLAALTPQQREKLSTAKIKNIRRALLGCPPDWLDEYAAAAVVSLPSRESRLRTLMFDALAREGTNVAQVFELIAKKLDALSEKERKSVAPVVLDRLGQCNWAKTSETLVEFEAVITRLLDSAGPAATPQQFAKAAAQAIHILKALFPDNAQLKNAEGSEPQQQIQPLFGDAFRKLLSRKSWGACASDISAVLWHEFWTQVRGSSPTPAAPSNGALNQQALIQEAAWYGADQAIAHALQDIGGIIRAFERLEAVATGDAATRTKSALGASKMVIQWVRQAAGARNIALKCSAGEQAVFDPVFHVSDDAALGEHVRVRKPPVVYTAGSGEAVLVRGEVELD